MDEYLHELERQAAKLLAQRFGRRPTSDESTVLELVTCLLEDGAGGVRSLPDSTPTTSEWLRWNRLFLEKPEPLRRTVNDLLLEEQFPLPKTPAALRHWAAWVVLSTLERL